MNKPAAASQNASAGNKQKKAYSLAAFRVLIVEDYPFMADLMSSMLREFGVGNIVQASSGSEGKELITLFNADEGGRNKIDVVLMDWLMPDGDGLELLQWMRAHKKDSIPHTGHVIFVTNENLYGIFILVFLIWLNL